MWEEILLLSSWDWPYKTQCDILHFTKRLLGLNAVAMTWSSYTPHHAEKKILTSLYFIADYSGDNTHILVIPILAIECQNVNQIHVCITCLIYDCRHNMDLTSMKYGLQEQTELKSVSVTFLRIMEDTEQVVLLWYFLC